MNATRDQVIAADLETVESEELEAAGHLYDALSASTFCPRCHWKLTLHGDNGRCPEPGTTPGTTFWNT